MKPCFFIFGFGYTAKVLAHKLLSLGFDVVGSSRTPDERQKDNLGVKLIDFNGPEIENYLRIATHCLICIPPANTGRDLVLMQYGHLIKKHAPYQWLGYLSSTGVYGDHQGRWVNENSDCIPHTSTAIARLKAEQVWMSFAKENGLPLHIFRLSGIYGPGRNVIQRLMQGEKKYSIFKEEQVFCRIHVEDIVSTLLASMASPKPLSIYNVSDDEPAPAHVVDNYATTLLQQEPLPLIPFSKAPLSPMEQSFYTNNRRVSNLKIKKELGVRLQYPTYKEGLTLK